MFGAELGIYVTAINIKQMEQGTLVPMYLANDPVVEDENTLILSRSKKQAPRMIRKKQGLRLTHMR